MVLAHNSKKNSKSYYFTTIIIQVTTVIKIIFLWLDNQGFYISSVAEHIT